MKTLIIISLTSLFFSCGTQKEVANNASGDQGTPTENQNPDDPTLNNGNYRVIGVVHLDKGCGAYIEAEIAPGEMKKLYPVNLEEAFKVEAAKIKFDYALSRAMLPDGCDADMTVTVSDVTRLRN
jgi:hypothetical protein